MNTSSERVPTMRPSPLVFLLPALLQGCLLAALQASERSHHWPATHPALWLALCEAALFVPVTVQLLAAFAGQRLSWLLLGALTCALLYAGWFDGHQQAPSAQALFGPRAFALTAQLLMLWLIALPFLQARLQSQRWSPDYRDLYALAWRNILSLLEAALFTLLFQALLTLWQTLFHMLGVDVFRDLFTNRYFVAIADSVAFGTALLLISSFEHWIAVVLEQLLSVLKWLGVLAGLILALFTLTLLVKLPALIASGHRALSAGTLLALVAAVVLFLNAAFRDGIRSTPYPAPLGLALRVVTPLLPIVALTAAYALWLRESEHGLTIERFWGLVTAAFAIVYALGYAAAALRGGPWMAGIARVNILTALALAAVLALTLTPLMAPMRLAAHSQYHRALTWRPAAQRGSGLDPFSYLHADLGLYGQRQLQRLAAVPGAAFADVRRAATRALAENATLPTTLAPNELLAARIAALPVYPSGRVLPPELRSVIAADMRTPAMWAYRTDAPWLGLYVALHAGQEQFVVLSGRYARVYQRTEDRWQAIGTMYDRSAQKQALKDAGPIEQAVQAGEVSAAPSGWDDLHVGDRSYRFQTLPDDVPATSPAAPLR
ncbi:MAG TPA: hypothetical protein VKT19_02435 [Steroidobacteraceae bacterium]|nr:hypothetical protein [Steroidobacteraceae bacterium]